VTRGAGAPLRPPRPRPRGVLPRPPGRPAAGRHAEPGRQHHVEALSAHLDDDPLPRTGPGRLGGPRLLVRLGGVRRDATGELGLDPPPVHPEPPRRGAPPPAPPPRGAAPRGAGPAP